MIVVMDLLMSYIPVVFFQFCRELSEDGLRLFPTDKILSLQHILMLLQLMST